MTELETVRTFYRFNARVRRDYLEAILALPPEERLRDRGASYPTLPAIYVHVLDALRFWFELVPGDRIADAQREERDAAAMGPEALRRATDEADALVRAFLEPLTDGDLAREIVCHVERDGRVGEQRFVIGDVLWHMVEEEFQHRGELNALLWQLDRDPPLGSYATWLESKGPGLYRP